MQIYIFYYEDEGEKGENSFTVTAKNHEDAFERAFESYGAQVKSMYYRPLSKEEINLIFLG